MDLLTQMTTYVRIVEAGSLSAAARRLRRSLPAVSRQLRALEDELGATLVLRTTRRLTVTEAGRDYYERCLRILRDVDDAQAAARRPDDVRGRLAISASVTFGLLRIAPLLPALRAAHPHLHLELRIDDHFGDLIADGIDVALRGGVSPPDSAGLITAPIGAYPRIPVAAPAYLRRRGEPREPEALARHDALVQITGTGAPATQWRFTQGERAAQIGVRDVFASNALITLRDAAIAGLGVAVLPRWLCAEALAAGRLKALLPRWSAPEARLYALYRAELRGAARVRAFVEHVRAGVADPA